VRMSNKIRVNAQNSSCIKKKRILAIFKTFNKNVEPVKKHWNSNQFLITFNIF